MLETLSHLENSDFPKLHRRETSTLQVNLGYLCNQQCTHCHVAAGPKRTEIMTRETILQVIAYIKASDIRCLDLTGGAPEMNPHFEFLVSSVAKLGIRVIDRCNLTILKEPGQENLVNFLAEHRVEVVASLPCYLEENVDSQRGKGVFSDSIDGLRQLNHVGYGKADSGLELNLVYNPLGPYLPPPQQQLREDYKKLLGDKFDVEFNDLMTITNMPIQRFGSTLLSKGKFDSYMGLLKDSYQQANLANVMCRDLISVDWQGYLFDCDFNQMLKLPIRNKQNGQKVHICELSSLDIVGNEIAVLDHCYACTAGQGSSCGGALS
ncbi:MAG: arsenosugar biosynthesis radical SAM (seleno)protein ArsS [Thiohalomonadales bacterium]